jgi:hypothetical protein
MQNILIYFVRTFLAKLIVDIPSYLGGSLYSESFHRFPQPFKANSVTIPEIHTTTVYLCIRHNYLSMGHETNYTDIQGRFRKYL